MLTPAAVADTLGCSRKHVYRLIAEGEITYVLLGKRKIGIPEESLAAFIKARTCRSEKTIVDVSTSSYVSGGKEFIASAQKARQRHRRKPSKQPSAKIYSLKEPEPQTA